MPEKILTWPIESITFKKEDIDFVLDTLTDVLNASLANFGKTAQFKLTIHLTKEPKCPKSPS